MRYQSFCLRVIYTRKRLAVVCACSKTRRHQQNIKINFFCAVFGPTEMSVILNCKNVITDYSELA